MDRSTESGHPGQGGHLSYGSVNALLGDLYEGWAQLKKAPGPEVERLAALVSDEQAARAKGKPPPTETQWETATAGRRTP